MFCTVNLALSLRETTYKARVAKHGEVFTPARVVNQMLDMLDAADWTDRNVVFVEPGCGDGAFVVELLRRRLPCVGIPVAVSTLWAIDIQADNVAVCRANALRMVLLAMGGFHERDLVFIAAVAAAIEYQVRIGDALAFIPADHPTYLALPRPLQEADTLAMMTQIGTLLNGCMIDSWLSTVFVPDV